MASEKITAIVESVKTMTGRREHFIYIIIIIRIFVSERNGYILNICKITLSNSRFCTKMKP